MGDIYEKFVIKTDYINNNYRYWMTIGSSASIWLETYKDKGAIYVEVKNLRPSCTLESGDENYYTIIFIGEKNDNVIHEELGKLYVNNKGEGARYCKFRKELIDNFKDVVLVHGKDVIVKGRLPYYKEEKVSKKNNPWDDFFGEAIKGNPVELFSSKSDETGAIWYVLHFDENKYGHIAVGITKEGRRFVGIPGRFLLEEQGVCGEGMLSLWQPLKGGEKYYESIDTMDENLINYLYGYWIGEIDDDGKFKKV